MAGEQCAYCSIFNKSSIRRVVNPKFDIQTRLCDKKDRFMYPEDEACDGFILSKRFWCVRKKYWMDTKVCVHRIRWGECTRCRQGKRVISIHRGWTKRLNRPKRKLILKRRRLIIKKRPTLLRRKEVANN